METTANTHINMGVWRRAGWPPKVAEGVFKNDSLKNYARNTDLAAF